MMRKFEKSGEKLITSTQQIPKAIEATGKSLLKIRYHLFILILIVLYLAAAPEIYARNFIKLGKPAEIDIDLPVPSPLIAYYIDSAVEVIITNQKVYQIVGWAFLENVPDQSGFDKYLVLNSHERVYFFHYDEVLRKDLANHFKDLGLDIIKSGFQGYISADAIRSGRYNVGFLFINRWGNDSYYTFSNRYFIRTPNTDSIETGDFPDESMVTVPIFSDVSSKYGSGKEFTIIGLNSDKKIKATVDSLSALTIVGERYSRLSGWAFLQDETDQSKYTRLIVLESDQKRIYYPVKFVERKEVQGVFPELTSRYSGFNVDILEESLPPGTYDISIVFQSRTQNGNYYTKTPWFITRTASDFTLGKR